MAGQRAGRPPPGPKSAIEGSLQVVRPEKLTVLRTSAGPICPSCGGGPDVTARGKAVSIPSRSGSFFMQYLRYPCSLGCGGEVDVRVDEVHGLIPSVALKDSGHILEDLGVLYDKASLDGKAGDTKSGFLALAIAKERLKVAGVLGADTKINVDARQVNLGSGAQADFAEGGPTDKMLNAIAEEAMRRMSSPRGEPEILDADYEVRP